MQKIGVLIFKVWSWVGVLLYLSLAFQMGKVLLYPGPTDGEIILTFGALMGFEFILVHSGVFMAVTPRKLSLTLLVPLYGLFALAMNAMVPGNAILWLYLSVILTRMRFAFSEASDAAKEANMLFSLASVMTYFFMVMFFAILSGIIPRFGITENYLDSVDYTSLHDSGGIFIDMPNVPITMGVLYFTILAYFEWRLYIRKPQASA